MRYGYIKLCPNVCSDEKAKQFLYFKSILETKKNCLIYFKLNKFQ